MGQHDEQKSGSSERTPGGSQREAGNADRKNLEIDRTQIHRTDTRQAEMGGDKADDKGRTQGLPTRTDADNFGGQGRMGPTKTPTRSGTPDQDQDQAEDADAKRVAESNAKQSTPDRSVGSRGIDGAVAEGVEESGHVGPDSPDKGNKAW